jgi:hypothetical protein
MIPFSFGKKGRKTILAYAFAIALSGPASNTLRNIDVVADSIICAEV